MTRRKQPSLLQQLDKIQRGYDQFFAQLGANSNKRRGKPLVWNGDSTCFSDLRFKDGIVYATFTDGSQYAYAMSKADAREWFKDKSVGTFFNFNIR